MLMISSDAHKLLEITKTMQGLHGEALVDFCLENEIGMISNPFGEVPEPTAQEQIEWHVFILFLASRAVSRSRELPFTRTGCNRAGLCLRTG